MIVWTCLLTLAGCGKKDMDYTMQNGGGGGRGKCGS